MIKNYIEIKRTARYFQSKVIDDKVKHIIFVFHGYAQNADDFLESLGSLACDEIVIVAPEGLSKFYWKDFTSNPSSSWMTSLERENEIKDALNYLKILSKSIANDSLGIGIQFHALGFSQGAAMASRFVANSTFTFSNLFLYAAQYAHDLDWKQLKKCQSDLHFHLIYGTEDLFISEEKVLKAEAFITEQEFKVNTFSFKGKHKIVAEAVDYIVQEILKNKSTCKG